VVAAIGYGVYVMMGARAAAAATAAVATEMTPTLTTATAAIAGRAFVRERYEPLDDLLHSSDEE